MDLDLHRIIRKLIFVPQLSQGRRTFLHFYWNGYAYSLREYAHPSVPPTPRYYAEVGLTVEEILRLAEAPEAFCIDVPAVSKDDVRYWYDQTVKANREFLGVEPGPTKAVSGASARTPSFARPAAQTHTWPASYGDDLRARFWRYRDEQFSVAAHLFDDHYQRGGGQPPVFKPEHAHWNVLVRPGAGPDEIVAVRSAIPDGMRHKWFRSMTSSQALAQSVFANLKYHGKLGSLSDVPGEEDLPPFPASVVRPGYTGDDRLMELEYRVDYLGEPRPTSVDAMFDGSYRIAVECKLSEPEVGECSRPGLRPTDSNFVSDHCDGSYSHQRGRRDRCALTERGISYWQYVARLLNWPVGADMRPCPLRASYQLVRNVLAASVRPGGVLDAAGHAVLLFDERNPAFVQGGKGYQAWQALHCSLKDPGRLRRCTWQDLIASLRQDHELNWLTEALKSKYGL